MKRKVLHNKLLPIFVFLFCIQNHALAKDTNKFIGAMYSVWFDYIHNPNDLQNPPPLPPIYPATVTAPNFRYWGEPAAGRYSSISEATITRHAEEMSDLGLDFIFIDLSNINGTEKRHVAATKA